MEIQEIKEIKSRCIDDIREVLPSFLTKLNSIDSRLWEYANDVIRTDIDIHNIDEILCLRRFLRYLMAYDFDTAAVREAIVDAEGTWDETRHIGRDIMVNGQTQHVDDGLKMDGIYGYGHYRLTRLQVFFLAFVYGPKHWVDTTSAIGSRSPLPTEKEDSASGHILDLRRVVTTFILEWPRKVAKTWVGAYVQFNGLLHGERDYEGYIVANSENQSKILFRFLKDMVLQKDRGRKKCFRTTQTEIGWLPWSGRSGTVTALAAGGKTKDGLKASTLSADEFGAAQRVKDHCDMEGTLNVVEGSMGPRREPLTIHTSTAGLGNETPYELLITNFQKTLLQEMELSIMDGAQMPDDWIAGHLLHPDKWECEDAELRTDRVIRKVNPNLGVTVQPSFYEKEWLAADKAGELKRKEVRTKLYNIFQTNAVTEWISPEEVRGLQVNSRIDGCSSMNGWRTFVGMDFSMGDDLHAVSYLAFRQQPGTTSIEFFADMDAWISQTTLESSSMQSLYQEWIKAGWLHVSPGKTLEPTLPVQRMDELVHKGITFLGWAYDPYKAKTPINALSAWLVQITQDVKSPEKYLRPMSQTYASYNPVVEELDFMIKHSPPLLHLSANPMWAWEAGNMVLDVSTNGMENKKMVKRNPGSDSCKVDNWQALGSALMLYDLADGRENK